jgi:hypothetical protein
MMGQKENKSKEVEIAFFRILQCHMSRQPGLQNNHRGTGLHETVGVCSGLLQIQHYISGWHLLPQKKQNTVIASNQSAYQALGGRQASVPVAVRAGNGGGGGGGGEVEGEGAAQPSRRS